jgi:hypothetical protein
MNRLVSFLTFFLIASNHVVTAFAPTSFLSTAVYGATTRLYVAADAEESDLVARRIVVTGDVQGGYYRSCVLNEVRQGSSQNVSIVSRLTLCGPGRSVSTTRRDHVASR